MRQCSKCGKGSIMGGTRKLLRGHYNPTNWSRKHLNLQKYRLPTGERVLVCTKCLKTIAKLPKKTDTTVPTELAVK